MMWSSRNAFTRSPISTALALGGGNTGMDMRLSRIFLVRSTLADDAARAGEYSQMMIGVAERLVDHGGALEVVADLVLHGHADAAVQLDRAFADDLRGASDLNLGSGNGLPPFDGVRFLAHHGGEHRHRARLLQRDQHVARAVLQYLEIADRHAELLALLEVVDGDLVHGAHCADGFGGKRRNAGIHGLLNQRM